ncbi:MAG: hypothetical protein ACYTKD_21895 [Planctomycetota bacterium]|jgi:hypothetical protein
MLKAIHAQEDRKEAAAKAEAVDRERLLRLAYERHAFDARAELAAQILGEVHPEVFSCVSYPSAIRIGASKFSFNQ